VLVNSIVGSLALGLVIFLGSILFVVPGIIAYVAFVFTLLYIAAEDQSFIAAFRSSWNVTRGNWLRLFGLLVIVFVGITVVPGVLSALTSAVFTATLGPALATLASGTLTLPFSLLVLGILAEAFTQLRTAQARSEPRTGASTS
jgi:membrane-anchored glycerophosphoryl diester phosphodiesterase (GDPDase)